MARKVRGAVTGTGSSESPGSCQPHPLSVRTRAGMLRPPKSGSLCTLT